MLLQARDYLTILESELLLALGCTEPIAIALCAAKGREILGKMPEKAEVFCSANVIKNTHSVTVPNSGGKKGIPFAAALGICGGDASRNLEVLASVQKKDILAAQAMVDQEKITVKLAKNVNSLYIHCRLSCGKDYAEATISGKHSRFTLLRKNDEIILDAESLIGSKTDEEIQQLKSQLNVKDIYDFARAFKCTDLPELCNLIERQVFYNSAIAKEGLSGDWGQQVGKVILHHNASRGIDELAAYAAAGSDARMSGCALPVVINSGSGNQGMTLSNPLIRLAQQLETPREKLYQALILANLTAIHEKVYIGSLSAYCGAVSAAAAASAGMAFLKDMPWDQVEKAIINTLAVSSGIICDGAKPSCAGKIAIAVKNAQIGVEMAAQGLSFQAGEGILGNSLEATIRNVGRLAKDGMESTDQEILDIMLGD